MPKKGQKSQKYNRDLVLSIVQEKLQWDSSYTQLNQKYNIPEGTISVWGHKYTKKAWDCSKRHEYPIKLLCEVLNISRATFYKYRNPKTPHFEEYLTIKVIFEEDGYRYAYRGLKKAILRRTGWLIKHKNRHGLVYRVY